MPKPGKTKTGALHSRLLTRGVAFPLDHGAEVKINCFNPRHNDENRSMSVNVVESLYVCSECGVKGNAYTYLRKFEHKTEEETIDILKDFGWSDINFAEAKRQMQVHADEKAGLPKHVEEPPAQLGKSMPAVNTWDYQLADQTLCVRMIKYKSKRSMKVLPYTPSSRGGWWMSGPLAENLPEEDRLCELHPLYRLPELLERIKPGRQIWVMKGENSVDAMLAVPPESFSDGPPPCTHVPVRIPLHRIDLSPLDGQKVLLISDKDSGSRDFMRELGRHLVDDRGCQARYCLPAGEGGHSIAIELAEGGWEQAREWAQGIGILAHSELPQAVPAARLPPTFPLDNTDHFSVLGISDETVIFQVKSTYQIISIRKSSLNSEMSLVTLAPLEYWLSQCDPAEGLSRKRRITFADKLLRAAEAKGMFDTGGNVLGRGAAKVMGGKVAFNLGNGLLLENDTKEVNIASEYSDHDEIFVPGQSIRIADGYSQRTAQGWASSLSQAIMRYRFLMPDMGRALLGWIVTSIIGGCLDFRPMIWLSSPAGTGKTYLIEKILSPVFGSLLRQMGDVTEAGISANMGYDSLPACIDEFEPTGGRNEEEKWLKILSLIRLATSGAGYRVRAGLRSEGARAAMSHPRFSVLLSSINQPQASTADQSRFYQIRLGGGSSNWAEIQDKIIGATEHDKTLMIRTHIIRNAAKIAEGIAAAVKASVKASCIPTREAQILASLTVGANFLQYGIISHDNMISRRAEDKVEDDSLFALSAVLTSLVRVPPRGEDLTLRECLIKSKFGTYDQISGHWTVGDEDRVIGKVAERYGLRLMTAESGSIYLFCNPRCTPLRQLLKKTDHSGIDLRQHLMNLPGAHQPMTGKGKKYQKRITMDGRPQAGVMLPEFILRQFDLIPCDLVDVVERDQAQQMASAAPPLPDDFDDPQI